jgi:DNA mismatch endonuclease (patch repair protein)
MGRIRSHSTKPEMTLRRALWAAGFRYRLKSRLPGRPDVVFPRQRVAVFVDGCFWHGCPEHSTWPQTNQTFWKEKLSENVRRDARVSQQLVELGWTVLRFWEHEVKTDVESLVGRVRDVVRPDSTHEPPPHGETG